MDVVVKSGTVPAQDQFRPRSRKSSTRLEKLNDR